MSLAAVLALSSLAACQRGDLGTDAFVALLGPRDGGPAAAEPRVVLDLQRAVQEFQQPPFDLPNPTGGRLEGALRGFYDRRHGEPAWFAAGRVRPEARHLLMFLAHLDEAGLDPADFRLPALSQALAGALRATMAPADAERLEIGLTWAALLAAAQLHQGRLGPQELRSRWEIEREPIDLATVLATALRDGELERTLRGLDPDHPQFVALLDALRRYRSIAAAGGWPVVPEGEVIGEGDTADATRLRALARRLEAEGFLATVPPEYQTDATASSEPLVYSPVLAEAVRAFQRTRTLAPDGRLGRETQAELAVTVDERLRQIALNVERWRWVPDDFGATTVLVNIPGYTLDVEMNRTIVESMAVVVGGKGWETPVFGDQIEHLVLNPYWNVPPRILAEEVLPRIEADPTYLASHDMEVVRGESDAAEPVSDPLLIAVDRRLRVRQRPGPSNPLGQVKFMFPNRHNVYLHDTPADGAFARPDRSASHGCIRVERPVELAELLLQGSSWSPERLRSTIASGQPAHVPLPHKLPVYLLYFTASVRPDGELHFYEDVYGIDAAHAAAGG